MSGEGIAAARLSARDHAACFVEAARLVRLTIVEERAGVLGLAREKVRVLDRQIGRGADDGEPQAVRRALLNFANEVAIGLHRSGDEDPAVRAAMRASTNQQEADHGVGSD